LIKTKRWMSAKNATKQKTSPLKKDRPTGKQGKVLSAEYIHESDEDDDEDMSTAITAVIPTATPTPKPATKPAAKPTTKPTPKPTPKPTTTPATKKTAKPVPKTMKRPREDEGETSDSSVPLSKKLKEDPPHRSSDASQASRNSSTAAPALNKAKDSSPQKSSPLSSPPTNASEFESSSGHISSSASPAHLNGKGRRSPIYKRHQKSSSVTSSVSSNGSHRALNPEVVDLARTYRSFYPKYEALYREVANSGGKRNLEREQDLLDMHERLRGMKERIVSGVIYLEH
jgi:RNA polymerase II elongation factor ELL